MNIIIASFLAGICIAIGGIVNLLIGGIAGAILFGIGLYTILIFDFYLYTGKAGLLIDKKIRFDDLGLIWLFNMFGTFAVAGLMRFTPSYEALLDGATAIAEKCIRPGGFFPLIILGIFCNILISIAVLGYNKTQNPIIVFVPVAVFILCGFRHSIADMFYGFIWLFNDISRIFAFIIWILTVTIGNFIGAQIIPIGQKIISRH